MTKKEKLSFGTDILISVSAQVFLLIAIIKAFHVPSLDMGAAFTRASAQITTYKALNSFNYHLVLISFVLFDSFIIFRRKINDKFKAGIAGYSFAILLLCLQLASHSINLYLIVITAIGATSRLINFKEARQASKPAAQELKEELACPACHCMITLSQIRPVQWPQKLRWYEVRMQTLKYPCPHCKTFLVPTPFIPLLPSSGTHRSLGVAIAVIFAIGITISITGGMKAGMIITLMALASFLLMATVLLRKMQIAGTLKKSASLQLDNTQPHNR